MNDYEQVFALWSNTDAMRLRSLDDSKEGIARCVERNPNTCFVSENEKDKRITGVILCGHDGRRGYIYHMAVETNVRKQGIGTMLVSASLNALKEQGIRKVVLVVFRKNSEGNSFWERQGFEVRDDLVYRNKSLDNENR